MRCVSITPLLFLATMLLALVTCQQPGSSICPCLKTPETVLHIKSYKIHKAGICHIDAIEFKTVNGFSTSTFKTESTLKTTSHWNAQDELGTSSPELIELVNIGPRPSSCSCLKTSETVLRKENIRSYKIQKAGVCHIDAIVFKTVRGLTFCSDPKKPWVKKAMKFVDEKNKAIKTTARPINSPSTFKTSTLNRASDWNALDELRTSSPELIEFVKEVSGFSYCPCLKTSETVLHKENIKSYKIHKAGVCHIDAIEFKTVNGLTFCANPLNLWAKRAIQFVDEKKATATELTASPIYSTSTFTTESTLKTTSHWNAQDEPKTSSPELIELVNICL